MISKTPFEEFNKKFDVAGAFIECEGEILMLLRQDGEPQGNKWSSVAGKVERGEIVVDGMAREIKEEAGIDVSPGGLKFLASYYTRYPSIDFVYHLYRIILKKKPEVKIRPDEHKEFRWMKPIDALKLDLIEDENLCIEEYYKID